jgi:hypothetical protein
VKCVRNQETGEIRRVNDLKAMRLVVGGPWIYEKKSAWKAQRAGAKSNPANE